MDEVLILGCVKAGLGLGRWGLLGSGEVIMCTYTPGSPRLRHGTREGDGMCTVFIL